MRSKGDRCGQVDSSHGLVPHRRAQDQSTKPIAAPSNLPVSPSWASYFLFAPVRRPTQRERNQRESAPDIWVWPTARRPSFRCSSGGLLTRAILGPLSLSRPSRALIPLRNTSTRPSEGIGVRVAYCLPAQTRGTRHHRIPFRRASGIVAEGVERHGCRESDDGPRMALRRAPLERRWSERTRSEA